MDKEIEIVVKILKNNEYRLSDGYQYYYAYDKDHHYIPEDFTPEQHRNFTVDTVLKEIASDIVNGLGVNNKPCAVEK